jgi:hypothetical protein
MSQAKRAYEGYAASTGGLTFDGRPMPKWDDLPARIQEAWRAALVAALDETPKPEADAQAPETKKRSFR